MGTTDFSAALIGLKNEKRARIVPSMDETEYIIMREVDGEKTLIHVSRKNGEKHYRPSMKAIFSDNWVLID